MVLAAPATATEAPPRAGDPRPPPTLRRALFFKLLLSDVHDVVLIPRFVRGNLDAFTPINVETFKRRINNPNCLLPGIIFF